MNGFRVTVMILMNLLDSRLQSIVTIHATIDIYDSDATDHIPDSETDMTLP